MDEQVGIMLDKQLRLLKRIRMCAEIWSLIGITILAGQFLGLLAAALLVALWLVQW
jgi:hypothetical protein